MIAGIFRFAVLTLMVTWSCTAFAQDAPSAAPGNPEALEKQVEELRSLVAQLSKRVESLEGRPTAKGASAEIAPESTTAFAEAERQPVAQTVQSTSGAPPSGEHGATDFLQGTTLNLMLDGYYGYNFNAPVGRVNLLRAYDVSSNSFSLNQATVVLERAPDVSVGRRFGARVDLQYGQATETVQGSASNELRPQTYRPIFQAYGTYIAPVGSGLTIDFGKWASSLGVEGNYNKDQINYSRSYFFNFLPFYHMGIRASYNLTSKVNLTYWLVNGAQQTEDFNGFKSQAFIFTLKPTSTVSWNVNYYFGQEQRDVVAVLNPGLPTEPTQPGLPTTPITPTPNGREHIFDSYLTWNATPKLALVGEADYVVNRVFSNSAPGHVTGGAAYARYQLRPKFALAGRAEYLSDRGGLFSGTTQALKETTITAEYKVTDGLISRWEWRRDFSNQPFFLTSDPGLLKKEQNTATVGLIWWWGGKQGSW
ncbi:MAG TPA: outer membrane beta-barrel protein [Candidatus Solibacter sp.]|nr:outer membrane beta-barrel protein [Candidatus Solibacter sp.]